jgi:uncharacterized protein YjbI with pentapeptide repeats
MIPNAFAENVPDWVKNTAGWWATDAISETEFVNAVEFLVKENIIQVNASQTSETSQSVPGWVKNTAGWWAEETISDNEFLNSLEFLINKGIIQIKAEQSELQILLQKRENLIDFIWKGDGFPTRLPDSIEQGISDKNFDDLKNLKKIDRITVEMKHGANSIAYLLYPKELSHNDLIIYHNGHNDYLYDGKKQIRFLLDRGYPVLVFSMPIAGMNSEPVIMLDGKKEKYVNHDKFELLESDKFSPISYFVEPIAVSLNFIDKNFDYNNYHMLGVSGGGWTTVIYPAIDQRISHATSVAGSIPLELRTLERDMGDYEQRLPELYRIANYYDLYVLASFGTDRKLTQVFNSNDPCCFAAKDQDFSYENEIKNRLASLGSGEFEIIVINTNYHRITGEHLISFYLDIDEKNVQYFYDTKLRAQNNDFSSIESNEVALNYMDVSNADFTASEFSNADFSNSNLTNTNFFSTVFDSINLTNTDITNSDFSYSTICKLEIEKTTIHNVDFTKSVIHFADFSKSDLKNVRFDNSGCFNCKFDNIDISEIKISENLKRYTNFAGSSFKNVDFRNWEHGKVDFGGKTVIDCSSKSLTRIPPADLTGSIFSNGNGRFVVSNLPWSDFEHSIFRYTNLKNVDLSGALFVDVDLTGANLAGANLRGTSFAYADLSGVSLAGAVLESTNFGKADLSGMDFTITDVITDGLTFDDANLSNSNFEGLDLSPKTVFFDIFQNKASFVNLSDTDWCMGTFNHGTSCSDLITNLFGKQNTLLIVSKEVRGNDLAVDYIFFNSFANANLENANFKNADLRLADFYSANLTNADLSGADMRGAFLAGANLEGAILDNAILSNANLKCINHPICNS